MHVRAASAASATKGHPVTDADDDYNDDDEATVAQRAAAPASSCWACRGPSSDAAPEDYGGRGGLMPLNGGPEKGTMGS